MIFVSLKRNCQFAAFRFHIHSYSIKLCFAESRCDTRCYNACATRISFGFYATFISSDFNVIFCFFFKAVLFLFLIWAGEHLGIKKKCFSIPKSILLENCQKKFLKSRTHMFNPWPPGHLFPDFRRGAYSLPPGRGGRFC